jgi:hypothetical protein
VLEETMSPISVAIGAATLWLIGVAAAGAVGAADPAAGAEQPVRLVVAPRFARAPAVVRIHAFVEPGADNRQLEVILESSDYYRSSAIEMSGADAPRGHDVEFRGVPVGTHDVRVVLSGPGGSVRAVAHDRVAVVE